MVGGICRAVVLQALSCSAVLLGVFGTLLKGLLQRRMHGGALWLRTAGGMRVLAVGEVEDPVEEETVVLTEGLPCL
jgi:hypothetical protein